MMQTKSDTIVALATPPGISAIAIVRLSGPKAKEIVSKVFFPYQKSFKWTHRYLHYGYIGNKERHIDQVLVSYFKAPHSYTAEDVIEINCHGGQYVAQKIIDLLIQNGARMAKPGEFSMRAFLNGKMDLSQAEAVVDLINAQSEQRLFASVMQLEGYLHKQINDIQQSLLNIRMLLEVELDFSEEDIKFASRDEILNQLEQIKLRMERFIDSYEEGRIIREGVQVAIVGRPNVGKSSTLNALLKKDRAIVTNIPGTTRDTIEESVELGGILFHFIDTAGIGDTKNVVEQEGISRTYRVIDQADIILFLVDASKSLTQIDRALLSKIQNITTTKKATIIILLNKCDLPRQLNVKQIKNISNKLPQFSVSALTGEGIDLVKKYLIKAITENNMARYSPHLDVPLTRLRHLEAFRAALGELEHAEKAVRDGHFSEFIAFDIRQAMDHLGEIIGTVTSDEILNRIFSSFCIGK